MNDDPPKSFPLRWPAGWPRTDPRDTKRSAFRTGASGGKTVTLEEARKRLAEELRLLGAAGAVVSTNVEPRARGRDGTREPRDPAVAVYFDLEGRPTVLACDRWWTVGENIAAVAAHINALRGQARWGVGSVARAFAGYAALPAPEEALAPDDWRGPLGNPGTLDEAEAAWRERMRGAHPDRGGTDAAAARLNAAIAAARRHFGGAAAPPAATGSPPRPGAAQAR